MSYRIENIATEGWDTIHKAAYCGNYDILLEELNNGISPNHISIKFKSKCKQPFFNDFDVYFSNMYPLYLAAQNGHKKCIKLLIDRGADPNLLVKNEYFNEKSNAYGVAICCNQFTTYRYIKKLMEYKRKKEFTSENHDNMIKDPLITCI